MSDQHDSLLQGLFRNPKSFVPVAFDGGDPLLSRLTVTLPGEALRALVQRVVGKDAVMVFLDQPPLMTGKTHSFKTGDFIPCRRSRFLKKSLSMGCGTASSTTPSNAKLATTASGI